MPTLCAGQTELSVIVTPAPAATSASTVDESGATWTIRGGKPADRHMLNMVARSIDRLFSGRVTNPSSASSSSRTLSRPASGCSDGIASRTVSTSTIRYRSSARVTGVRTKARSSSPVASWSKAE
jgi:hypothetical protein